MMFEQLLCRLFRISYGTD